MNALTPWLGRGWLRSSKGIRPKPDTQGKGVIPPFGRVPRPSSTGLHKANGVHVFLGVSVSLGNDRTLPQASGPHTTSPQ
jgi:hypothetical protein